MMTDVQKSVKDFENHLESKISLYNASQPNENSARTYDELKNEFDLNNITIHDIATLTKKRLEEILDGICLNQITKERLLNEFLKNKKDIESNRDYFIEIITHIKVFTKQYEARSSLTTEYSYSKINECKKYLELMSSKEITTYTSLEDFEQFVEFINNQGLIDEDKANLIEFINELNINLAKKQVISPNLTNKVIYIVNNFIKEEYFNYIEAAEELIEGNEIDLDILETLAKKKADEYELSDATLLYNVILSLLIISKYNEMKESTKEINKTEIDELFSKLHINDELLTKALVIIQENVNALLIPKDKAKTYIDVPLEELSDIMDEAVMFKLSSLIIDIKELYDEIISEDKNNDNYMQMRNRLEELIEKYNINNKELISKHR